jgi:membrane-associated phospholipid phosphatase
MRGVLLVFLLLFSCLSYGDEQGPKLFDGFWKNTKESFTENWGWHLTAIGVTPILIETGVDAGVHTTFEESDVNWFLPAVSAGYLLPFISIPMYAEGRAENSKRLTGAAFAVAQTSIIALSTVSILKTFTGRPAPNSRSNVSAQKQSEEFNFGFLNRGIYDGWPSGHMATITSIASSMIHYYPEQEWIKYLGYSSMGYTLLAVSAEHRGQFHWFSDGVAGGLMGWAIGKTVGNNMRASLNGVEAVPEKKTVDVLPIFGQGRSGVMIVWYQ